MKSPSASIASVEDANAGWTLVGAMVKDFVNRVFDGAAQPLLLHLATSETLSPTERAVFVLREAFEVGYDEIAAAVGRSPAAVRQIAHRARQHVDARRPREVVSSGQTRAALESLQRAFETGDLQGLLDVLAVAVELVLPRRQREAELGLR